MQYELRDAERYGYTSKEIEGTLCCFIPQTADERIAELEAHNDMLRKTIAKLRSAACLTTV